MEETRLHLLDRNLAQSIARLNEIHIHTLIIAVCKLTIERSGLENPLTEQALNQLQERKYNNQKLIENLTNLTEKLDEAQWDLLEKMKEGEQIEEEQTKIFKQARTANTLLIAISDDSLETTLETVYESIAATDDINTIKALMNNVS